MIDGRLSAREQLARWAELEAAGVDPLTDPALRAGADRLAAMGAAGVEAMAELGRRLAPLLAGLAPLLAGLAPLLAEMRRPRGVARLCWAELRDLAGEPGDLHRRAVADALHGLALDGDDLAAECRPAGCVGADDPPTHLEGERARDKLARNAARLAAGLLKAWPEPPADDDEATRPADAEAVPMLAWDARLADWLDLVEQAGQAEAEGVRRRARERWATWTGTAAQLAVPGVEPDALALWAEWAALPVLLARLAWSAHVRDWWRQERARLARCPPAVSVPLFDRLVRLQAPGARLVDSPAVGAVVVDRSGREVAALRPELAAAAVALEVVPVLVRQGVGQLASLTGHRLVRWAVYRARDRAVAGEADARVLVVEGGWAGLAEAVGARSNKARAALPAIVAAGAHLWWPAPGGHGGGNLWAYTDRPAAGQQRARVELVLGTMVSPAYVHGLPRGEARALVPMPPLPPMVGREHDYGAQAALQLATTAELRHHARELARDGAVRVSRERWEELARAAGLPLVMLARVLDRWTQDGDDGPAFLARHGRDRYTLADGLRGLHDFLEEAGRRELAGEAGGKRAARGRRSRLLGRRK